MGARDCKFKDDDIRNQEIGSKIKTEKKENI